MVTVTFCVTVTTLESAKARKVTVTKGVTVTFLKEVDSRLRGNDGMKWKKKVLQYNVQWFSAVKAVLALATAAIIGTMMPSMPVFLTVTTLPTLTRIATTITARGSPKPLVLYV